MPADFPFPDEELEWGVEEVARERFAPYADGITFSRLTLRYDATTRAAAGDSDFVAQYFRKHLPAAAVPAVAAARDDVVRRFIADGAIVAEYALVAGRAHGRETARAAHAEAT